MTNPDKPANPAEPEKAPPGFVSDPEEAEAATERGPATTPDPEHAGGGDDPIERLARANVEALLALEIGSSEFGRLVDAFERLGEREFVTTAAMSGRLLDRRFRAIDSALLGSRSPLARQLVELRKVASGMDPSALKFGGKRSSDDELRELDRYFERFAQLQPRLQAILDRLNEGRFLLEQDNTAISGEDNSLAAEVETLRRYAGLAERIDSLLSARIDAIEGTDPARADRLRVDALEAVRRRRQEVLTQQAIATQGLAALRIVRENNDDVIRALASAISTTTTAMRTAVMTAQAAASQRIALGHLQAARMAVDTMADHAAALEKSATGPGGRVDTLRQAWQEVYAALDRVDEQKARAVRTIAEADRELTRPKFPSR